MASVTSTSQASDDIPTLAPTLSDVMTSAIQSAVSASLSKTAAATSAGIASSASASAAISAASAAADVMSVTGSATSAAASATAASGSATAAAASATSASGSATAAAASASAASTSATDAAASASLAATYAADLSAGAVASVNGKTGIIVLAASDVGALAISGNLSDVANVATARANLGIDKVTLKGDIDYTILATDRAVSTSATFTAAHTWTLPAANSVNAGQTLLIRDGYGTITSSHALTIARAGSDLINGQSTLILNSVFAGVSLVSDGVSNWSFPVWAITEGGTGATTASDARTSLGLGTAATSATTDFLQPSNNLTDVSSATTARGSLSAAKSGANSDITSLTGLTTPLSVAQGGTGSGSAPTAINGLSITSTSSAALSMTASKTLAIKNSLTFQGTDATTFTFPSSSANVLTDGNTATIGVGFKVTPYAYTTGSITINPALGNYAYVTNGGAFTITAPTSDCAVDLLITNNASAGAITFSGFTVGSSTGSSLDTTNGHYFLVSIRRINGISTYSIYALQ